MMNFDEGEQIILDPYDAWGDLVGDEAQCKVCGCTQNDPCPGGCIWATEDVCSSCIQSVNQP